MRRQHLPAAGPPVKGSVSGSAAGGSCRASLQDTRLQGPCPRAFPKGCFTVGLIPHSLGQNRWGSRKSGRKGEDEKVGK